MKARASGDRSPLSAPDRQNLVGSVGSRAPVYETGGRTFESCTRCQQRVCGREADCGCLYSSLLQGHGGSNPSAPTSHTGLAQLAERRPPKSKVRGSTPWSGASPSRRSQVVEGIWLQTRRQSPRPFESDRRVHITSPIAQWAERLAVNQEVRGSKPRRGASSV